MPPCGGWVCGDSLLLSSREGIESSHGVMTRLMTVANQTNIAHGGEPGQTAWRDELLLIGGALPHPIPRKNCQTEAIRRMALASSLGACISVHNHIAHAPGIAIPDVGRISASSPSEESIILPLRDYSLASQTRPSRGAGTRSLVYSPGRCGSDTCLGIHLCCMPDIVTLLRWTDLSNCRVLSGEQHIAQTSATSRGVTRVQFRTHEHS